MGKIRKRKKKGKKKKKKKKKEKKKKRKKEGRTHRILISLRHIVFMIASHAQCVERLSKKHEGQQRGKKKKGKKRQTSKNKDIVHTKTNPSGASVATKASQQGRVPLESQT